jgi:hypothetical protein
MSTHSVYYAGVLHVLLSWGCPALPLVVLCRFAGACVVGCLLMDAAARQPAGQKY